VFAIATDIVSLWGCSHGYGKHANDLQSYDRKEAFKVSAEIPFKSSFLSSRSLLPQSFYVTQITYKTSINLTKASILLLYLRIFSSVKWFRWTCLVVLSCVASYCVAAILVTVFQCSPVVAAFDKSITEKTCINNGHFWLANAGFSIATDIIILTIPMPLVYSLQIPRVQKAALVFVFTLGAL
jgi:hypothetical protein